MIGGNHATDFRSRMSVVRGLTVGLLAVAAFALSLVASTAQNFPNMLFVSVSGPGTVTASSPGPVYPVGATVTLTAVPAPGSALTGWSGADGCSTALTCTITMNEFHNVVVTFSGAIPPIQLTTSTMGNGSIYAFPSAAGYVAGTTVILTAIARPGKDATFTGWSGA